VRKVPKNSQDGGRQGASPQKKRGERMIYIQRRADRQLETVDEFSTIKEARAMLIEYRISDPTATYYLSRRPCNEWKTK
jgi:hypothetical protein